MNHEHSLRHRWGGGVGTGRSRRDAARAWLVIHVEPLRHVRYLSDEQVHLLGRGYPPIQASQDDASLESTGLIMVREELFKEQHGSVEKPLELGLAVEPPAHMLQQTVRLTNATREFSENDLPWSCQFRGAHLRSTLGAGTALEGPPCMAGAAARAENRAQHAWRHRPL